MSLRRIEKFGLTAALCGGFALAPGTVSDGASRMLVTFLGLFSASLLPTITLLVNGMTASGRSVHSINDLDREIQAAMDALFLMFGCAAVAFGSLMMMAIDPPPLLVRIPFLTTQALPRLGQALVVFSVGAIVWRAGQIPAILRRALSMRKEIALEEARKKVNDKVAAMPSIRDSFANHPDFGKVVTLEELQGRERL